MDNRTMAIQSEGRSDFEKVMTLAIRNYETVGYRLHDNCLILYRCESGNMTPLPYKMNPKDTIEFAYGWFEKSKPSKREPDHDGDNGIGFLIYNESWGKVLGEWEAYIAITPIWALYGK